MYGYKVVQCSKRYRWVREQTGKALSRNLLPRSRQSGTAAKDSQRVVVQARLECVPFCSLWGDGCQARPLALLADLLLSQQAGALFNG